MKRIFKRFRLSENIEVLFMLTLGIVLQTIDGSPFSIKKKWMTVWETELPSEHFSQFVQHCIKTILSCIVVMRCSTTYIYVISALLVMFSIIKDSFPRLMLIWLLLTSVKSVLLTFIEALTGVYVCSAFGAVRKSCLEFFISKALELIFSTYLWFSVLKIYQEMIQKELNRSRLKNLMESRPRARSLLDESTLQKTARLNSFEFKDVPQIILQMLQREEEMSQDSLLGSGMMLASVSNFGSFEDLKTSQSLGELGLLDLKAITVMGIEEDDPLTPPERALKFLKMTWNDVRIAQETKTCLEKEIFLIDDEIWNRITGSHPFLSKPRQTRPEIVLQQISHSESEEEVELLKKESRQRSIDLKFGFSLFSFIREKDELHLRDEEQLSAIETLEDDGDDEDDEDSSSSPLFMSNIRDEVAVNRIRLDFVSKKYKGNAYAKLYKEEYMSVIGPEVFDRATKLPKVAAPVSSKIGTRASVSLPAFIESGRRSRKKINFDTETEDKGPILSPDNSGDIKILNDYQFDDLSRSASTFGEKPTEVDYSNNHPGSFHSLNEDFSIQESVLMYNKPSTSVTDKNQEDVRKTDEKDEESNTAEEQNNLELDNKVEESKPEKFPMEIEHEDNRKEDFCFAYKDEKPNEPNFCYRSRRIKIRRIGPRPEAAKLNSDISKDDPSDRRNDSDGFTSTSDQTAALNFCQTNLQIGGSKRSVSVKEVNKINVDCREQNKHSYMVTKVLHHPFVDLITTYHELKPKTQTTEHIESDNCHTSTNASNISLEFLNVRFENKKETKIWKSKVLKKAAPLDPTFKQKEQALRFSGSSNYWNFLSDVLTRNLLFTKYPKGTKKISAVFDEKRVTTNNKQRPSVQFLAEKYLARKPSNYSLKLSEIQESDLPPSSRKLCDSHPSGTCEYPSCTKMGVRKSSESRIVRKWINSAFIDTKSRVTNQVPISFLDMHSEQLPELKGEDITTPDGSIKENHEPGAFEEDPQPGVKESEESFSLYYSKAADLASPLMDMKRFIYPDHIHYSYKHVKKKGFDVNINSGLPLLVRESLTMNNPIAMRQATSSQDSNLKIIRRPMDLSFATTNSWQNENISLSGIKFEAEKPDENLLGQRSKVAERQPPDHTRDKKSKKCRKVKKETFKNPKSECKWKNLKGKELQKYLNELLRFSEKEVFLVEKFLKVYNRLNCKRSIQQRETVDTSGSYRPPVPISSAQLHSNKGKVISSNYNPAVILNENKTRSEKKKMVTQEERAKVMIARLEREILFQKRTQQKNFKSFKLS